LVIFIKTESEARGKTPALHSSFAKEENGKLRR